MDSTITKLTKAISGVMANNRITLTNLAVTLITVGLNVLLEDEVFDCPHKDFETYGYMFLIFPCVILLFANMMVIVTDWDLRNLSKDLFSKKSFCKTIPSVIRVFVAPIVWLIVSFAEADFYVCAKVGPNPDNVTNLTMKEIQDLKYVMESTKTESQMIAWGLFLGMVFVIFVVIFLENVCCDKSAGKVATAVAFTASSELGGYSASKAQLNSDDAWVPAENDPKPWLQVNFESVKNITKVATQGGFVGGKARYVETYTLLFSNRVDFQEFEEFKCKESGSVKVFNGNSDGDTVTTNCLDPPTHARYWRLVPREWKDGQFALRLKLYES